MQKDKELFDSMRNIVILNSLHFSYPLPILMRVSYNTLIVKQNTSDYYKYTYFSCLQMEWGYFFPFNHQAVDIFPQNEKLLNVLMSLIDHLLIYELTN